MNKVNQLFGNLEYRLYHIRQLKSNLSACNRDTNEYEVSKRHLDYDEEVCTHRGSGILYPYEEKREAARTGLDKIYRTDVWFFARYKAAKALKVPEGRLNNDLGYWISSLYYDHNCRVITKGTEAEEEKKDFLPAKARKDLRKFYTSWSVDAKHKREAGTHLGYSSARIWTKMHMIDFALVASGAAFAYTVYSMVKEVFG